MSRLSRMFGALLTALALSGLVVASAAAQDDEEGGLELAAPELRRGAPPASEELQLPPVDALPEADQAEERDLHDLLNDDEFWGEEEEEESWVPTEEPAEGALADDGHAHEADAHDDDHAEAAEHGEVGHDADAEHGEEHAAGEEGHGAGSDHGAEGEHHEAHLDPMAVAATVVNFLMWLALVVWLGRKPVAEFLKARRLSVEEGLVEAKRLGEQAQQKYEKYSEQLDHLDQELERMRGEMIAAGEAERDRIIEEAEARAARMRRETTFVLEQRVKQLRADLTQEAIEAAVNAAEQVLVAQIASPDQQQLANTYLDGLSGALTEASEEDEARA